MRQRQIIIVLSGAVIIFLGVMAKNFMATPPEKKKTQEKKRLVTVFTDEVRLGDIPIDVMSTGSLEAKNRMELYSEVQGLMLPDGGRFKAGTSFSKGQTLLSLRADDARARVVSQRSAFERSLSTVMADIRLDYPLAFDSWSAYLSAMDVENRIADLPEVTDSKLRSYLTGRNIFADYYSVRNAEIGLSRYRITAPFSGVLVSANVDPGTVIRPSQLLGVFVKPGTYEIQASADAQTVERLAVGHEVTLRLDGQSDTEYTGNISRINTRIDARTQMGDFFVEVDSDELREGQYMQVIVEAGTIEDAYEIDRSAIKDRRLVFVVENGTLASRDIDILHTTERTAVIQGVENGEEVLTKLPPTAFEGMEVTIYEEEEGDRQ